MTEQELRALVRDAIAKAGLGEPGRSGAPSRGAADAAPYNVSHAMFALAPADPEGRCIIEPGVQCNHCGYCKSYGH